MRARQIPQRANCAYDVHTFWPDSSQPSSTRTALVCSDARSEPASGSLKSWHQISSAVRIAGSQRCFCSSVPCASSVGPARLMPTRLIGCSARDRAYSMLKIATCTGDAPRPPYSSGQWMPTQRPPASSRLPRAAELDLLGDRLEARRHLDVRGEPLADLARERLLFGGEREVHAYRSQNRSRP